MITKGIIKSIDFNGNSCIVRMPYFETAGSNEVICEALVSNTPGIYNGYKEDDVVWVAFEDGRMETPVVLGKLYLGASKEKQDPRGTINCVDSTISGTATIPNDTRLKNDLDYGQINTTIPYRSLSSLANNLQRVDIEQGQNNRDLGNRLRTVVDGIGPDGSKLYSLIEQTDTRLTNEVGRKLDTESGAKEQAFGWDLTADSWRLFAKYDVEAGTEGATKVINIITRENDQNVQKAYVIINGVNSLELTDTNKAVLGIIGNNYSVIKSRCVLNGTNKVWEIYNNTDPTKKIATDVPADTKEVLTATEDGLDVNGSGTFTGAITASEGYIGKFIIGSEHNCSETGKLESGIYSTGYIDAFESTPPDNAQGVYVGTDGIKLGTNFSVDKTGNVTAKTLKTIISTETKYAIGISGTSHDDIQEADWKTTIEATTNAKPFLWSRTKTVYTVGEPEYTYAVSSNVSVTSTTVEYQNSADGTNPPSTGTWTGSANPEQGKFTWTRTTVTYSDGHTSVSYSVSYTGSNGKDGQDGQPGASVEVKSTEVRYASSTDGTNHPADAWTNWSTSPSPTKGQYLWSWTKIKYTDTNIADTDLYNVSYMGSDADISKVTDTYILEQLGIPSEATQDAGLYYGTKPGTDEKTLYVNADYLTAKKLKVTNSTNSILLDAGATNPNGVTIGGFTVGTKALYSPSTFDSMSTTGDGVYVGTDGIKLGKNQTFAVNTTGDLFLNGLKLSTCTGTGTKQQELDRQPDILFTTSSKWLSITADVGEITIRLDYSYERSGSRYLMHLHCTLDQPNDISISLRLELWDHNRAEVLLSGNITLSGSQDQAELTGSTTQAPASPGLQIISGMVNWASTITGQYLTINDYATVSFKRIILVVGNKAICEFPVTFSDDNVIVTATYLDNTTRSVTYPAIVSGITASNCTFKVDTPPDSGFITVMITCYGKLQST